MHRIVVETNAAREPVGLMFTVMTSAAGRLEKSLASGNGPAWRTRVGGVGQGRLMLALDLGAAIAVLVMKQFVCAVLRAGIE